MALAWAIRELVNLWRRNPNGQANHSDPLYNDLKRDIERLERSYSKLAHDVAFIKGSLSKGSKSDQEGF